ncbi:MAG: hypothetical protein UX81_C0018G0014 [Parcubacteria group bacterium GW2011_GWA2_47_12]|nr:MAG: hypothetical protein UX81_C0018G0014 [Parcubacteria group bacterium GW2011_GWA2_47_12]
MPRIGSFPTLLDRLSYCPLDPLTCPTSEGVFDVFNSVYAIISRYVRC